MKNILSSAIQHIKECIDSIKDSLDMYNPEKISKTSRNIADEIKEFINSLLVDYLTEEFSSKDSLRKHFDRHCIGKRTNRKSETHCVYYDFTDNSQYSQYEKKMNSLLHDPEISIPSLYDTQTILKAFRKLFEGNVSILFTAGCGFENKAKPLLIGFHSFATDVTKNYQKNTIDLIVMNKGKTITLYPLDANYVETKFNDIIKKYKKDKNVRYYFNL